MRNKNELYDAIDRINLQILELSATKNKLKKQLVERYCPLKVDDVIINNYTFTHENKKIRIIDITMTERKSIHESAKDSLKWKADAVVIKADGTDSLHKVEILQWMYDDKEIK